MGPDQILPATSTYTTNANDRVKLCIEKSGLGSINPISVPGEYEKNVRTCAKAFLRLGLKRHHSVCIIGFNAPEWFFSCLGAIYSGGISAGIYTTASEEMCKYCIQSCRANIIVVENKKLLDKILKFKDSLEELKVIVQYNGIPDAEGVISWKELTEIGEGVADKELDNIMKTICINECCSIIFTSGTTGKPKQAMLSHDNIIWNAALFEDYIEITRGKEVLISYLPLNHIAGQLQDIYLAIKTVATGTLLNTLQEVQPTKFFGVPRIWEKIYESQKKITMESGIFCGITVSMAMQQCLQYYLDKMNRADNYRSNLLYLRAKRLVSSKIKQNLGFSRCINLISGGAPISSEIKKFFMSIDMPLKDVCLRGRHVFMGYLNDPENTTKTLQNGWLHTGDLGKVDTNGFIRITGRIKEIIITAGGENIAPAPIEEEVKNQLPCIRNAMVVGDKQKYLIILLTMKTEMNIKNGEPLDELTSDAKEWCRNIGCEINTVKDVLEGSCKKFMAAIQKGIDAANTRAISNAHRIQKFTILPHDFSIPTGELGPTMKLMRNTVVQKYGSIIDKLYEASKL
ncbi:Very long-chain-fatty-acid--CoA ligase bubblegum [Blattella germanica]|nr:Very long-chain-fatty-acid--CoA ligase bubblegum [Blattella germanica]